jgi:signal transduction histidine kinase/predicted RNA-binding protein with RPS1 domain/DNA-binding NarL/FixJ family response regulator
VADEDFSRAVERNYPRWSRTLGRVTQVRHYGVFVEFDDGIQGIIRRRELAWDDTPAQDLVAPGQPIEVVVVDADHEAQRLILSRRLAERDPWHEFLASFRPGQVVRGQVIRVMPYGAFVEITPGVVGLVRIGEVAPWFVDHIEDVLWVGDGVRAEILSIDPAKRHIALSIKKYLKHLEREATQATITEYVSREPEMQVSLGDQLGLSAAQLRRQVWGEVEQAQRKVGLKRILVVDDEEALADFMESWMYGLGYEVEAIYSGAAGVERALRGDYGLIFMDLNLPDISGLEATRRILAERPSSRIVLMTGAGLADENSAEIEAIPFTTVLLKPFSAQEIEALLDRLESGEEARPGQVLLQPIGPLRGSESLAAEIGFFQRVSQAVEERGALAHALRQGLEELRTETQASAGAVFEMDPVTRSVALLAHSGEALSFDQFKHRLSESPVKDVILERQVVWEKDAQKRGAARFRYLLPLIHFESCIGVPIKAQGGVRHGLFLFHPAGDHFSAHHLQRALSTSLVMGAAIERREVERMVRSFQRLLLVGQLSGGLAHEVNNKLASLEFHTRDLLRGFERLAREQPDLASTFLYRDLQRTAETIAEMNRGVLETARMFQTLIAGEEPQLVNVNEIIQRTLRLLGPLARKHQVALKSQLAEGLPRTLAVGVRLQQAFHNVILNGIQQIAQQHRGGSVEVSSEHKPDAPVYPIQIRIADDGPGIHHQHFDQIFSLGFTTRRQEGTGLGLYITRGLVESMGGRISIAESVMLVGTTFLIELPLVSKEESSDA